MAELVREHGAQLRLRQHPHQGQAHAHHALAAKPHDPTTFTHPSVHVRDEIHLRRGRLAGGAGDALDLDEQARMLFPRQARAGRLAQLAWRVDPGNWYAAETLGTLGQLRARWGQNAAQRQTDAAAAGR